MCSRTLGTAGVRIDGGVGTILALFGLPTIGLKYVRIDGGVGSLLALFGLPTLFFVGTGTPGAVFRLPVWRTAGEPNN
jgi:hypothetical protein